jgi:hypothetical protein
MDMADISVIDIGDGIERNVHDVIARTAASTAATASSIANVENSTTATRNYAIGEYLIYNKVVYRVTSAITAGDTIVIGTNVVATTLTAEIVRDSAPTQDSTKLISSGAVYAGLAGKENTLIWDSTPTENSNNPVTSGGIYTALVSKQGTLTFDTTPTENSANPVTSGGIYTALAGKQGTLTFDTAPTENSANPVTSGGIYTAIQNSIIEVDSTLSSSSTHPVQNSVLTTRISHIETSIAPVEASSTATRAYAIGDYVILEGVLYRVTAAISIGDTIAVNTNVVVTDVISAISRLMPIDIRATLTAGSTTLTVNNAGITDNSIVDVYVDASKSEGIVYEVTSVSVGSVTVTFRDAQATDVAVLLRVTNI